MVGLGEEAIEENIRHEKHRRNRASHAEDLRNVQASGWLTRWKRLALISGVLV